jgi:hypothetical protein
MDIKSDEDLLAVCKEFYALPWVATAFVIRAESPRSRLKGWELDMVNMMLVDNSTPSTKVNVREMFLRASAVQLIPACRERMLIAGLML